MLIGGTRLAKHFPSKSQPELMKIRRGGTDAQTARRRDRFGKANPEVLCPPADGATQGGRDSLRELTPYKYDDPFGPACDPGERVCAMRVMRIAGLWLAAVALCLFVAREAASWWVRHHTEPVRYGYGEVEELPEEAVVAQFGQPVQDVGYLISLGPPGPGPYPPPGTNRTLVYHTQDRLRQDRGTLYVYLELRDGKWVCSSSVWVREGVVF